MNGCLDGQCADDQVKWQTGCSFINGTVVALQKWHYWFNRFLIAYMDNGKIDYVMVDAKEIFPMTTDSVKDLPIGCHGSTKKELNNGSPYQSGTVVIVNDPQINSQYISVDSDTDGVCKALGYTKAAEALASTSVETYHNPLIIAKTGEIVSEDYLSPSKHENYHSIDDGRVMEELKCVLN